MEIKEKKEHRDKDKEMTMDIIMLYLAGVLTGIAITGLTVVGPFLFRKEHEPTKEEWKAGWRPKDF